MLTNAAITSCECQWDTLYLLYQGGRDALNLRRKIMVILAKIAIVFSFAAVLVSPAPAMAETPAPSSVVVVGTFSGSVGSLAGF